VRARVRERARRRKAAGGVARRACLVARLSAVASGIAAPYEAHPEARLRLRPERRARDADQRAVARRRLEIVKTDITTERDQVIEELRLGEKFLLTTHENPDGDALGSLVAMHMVLNLMARTT